MNSSSALVSVIMPVYNGERYLAETLQNLLNLGFPHLEVIVVDDGSVDSSATIAASFGDAIRYIHQENAGPAAARNRGLEIALGDVIGFLDADDFWTPALVQEVLPLLLRDDALDIVQGRIQEFQDDAGSNSVIGSPYEYLNLGSAVFRRRVFADVGLFDVAMPMCEDYDWWLRAYDRRIRKRRIAATTLLYRIHPESATHGRSIHEIGMARAHKKAIARRRLNPTTTRTPADFPALVEYIGRGKAEVGEPRAVRVEQAPKPATQNLELVRRDDRPLDLPADAIAAFMVVRNERARLPYCLDYHRRLGVARFFVVDNDSTDGSGEWLLAQPDVHVWHTPASFGAARCGTDWTETLLKNYGQERWCLVIDADELLVYPDSETKSLNSFCVDLEQSGYRAALALMIDMYADRPIRETQLPAGAPFLEACCYFDRAVYHDRVERFYEHDQHPSFFGGVRRRVFGGQEPGKDERYFYCLNKAPLLKYDPSIVLSANLHWTSCRDIAVQAVGLLHFKFFADFADSVGQEAQRKEHWNEGIQYARYAETLSQNPDLSLFNPTLSVCYENTAQFIALDILRPLVTAATVQSTPHRPEVPMSDDRKQMLRQVRGLIKAQKSQENHPHAVAMALLKQGLWGEAAAGFEAAIAAAPEFSWSYHYLGDALVAQDRWPEAIAAYQRAIELNPHFAASYFNLGEVYAWLQQWPDAAESYRQALALQADLPNAAHKLAQALSKHARQLQHEAQKWYRQANVLAPDDMSIYIEASDLRPPDPDLCLQFADALAARGHRSKAIFFYQLTLQVRPDDAAAYARMASVLQQDGDLPNAIACCRQAMLLDNTQVDYPLQIGDLLMENNDVEGAISSYRLALDLDPDQPALHKRMGDLLARTGQLDAAAVHYANAVARGYQEY